MSLFTKDIGVWLILYSKMLNQLQNWIMKELVLLWVPMVPSVSSHTLLAWVIGVGLALGSLLCIRAFW